MKRITGEQLKIIKANIEEYDNFKEVIIDDNDDLVLVAVKRNYIVHIKNDKVAAIKSYIPGPGNEKEFKTIYKSE